MVPCSSCSRHVRAADATCPFCGASAAPARRAFQAVMAVATPFLLAACYGMSPKDCDTAGGNCFAVDADGDGFDVDDCDDEDETVNPGATEVCDDGIDNDCDDTTDDADSDCAT